MRGPVGERTARSSWVQRSLCHLGGGAGGILGTQGGLPRSCRGVCSPRTYGKQHERNARAVQTTRNSTDRQRKPCLEERVGKEVPPRSSVWKKGRDGWPEECRGTSPGDRLGRPTGEPGVPGPASLRGWAQPGGGPRGLPASAATFNAPDPVVLGGKACWASQSKGASGFSGSPGPGLTQPCSSGHAVSSLLLNLDPCSSMCCSAA